MAGLLFSKFKLSPNLNGIHDLLHSCVEEQDATSWLFNDKSAM